MVFRAWGNSHTNIVNVVKMRENAREADGQAERGGRETGKMTAVEREDERVTDRHI